MCRQEYLRKYGYLGAASSDPRIQALSGRPNKQFKLAVKNFQRFAGLRVTGELLMPDEYTLSR